MAITQILSHLPGIFYRKPSPDAAPFKEVGDMVNEGDVVGLVEVMKSFHEVKAESPGKIVAFHIGNEEPVMAGQPVLDLES